MTWVYEGTTYKNKYLDLWKFDVFFFLHMFYNGTVLKKGHQIFQRIFRRSKKKFYSCSTKEYYKKDIVELSYSFSMYTRNNIKKISNLPVYLWKIENQFLSLNFHTRFLRTRHHVISKSPPYSKSQTHITTTNNKTHKPPPMLPSNGGHSQNSSRRYSSSAHRARSTKRQRSINERRAKLKEVQRSIEGHLQCQ